MSVGHETEKKEIDSLADIGALVKVPPKAPVFNYYRYAKGDLEAYDDNSGKVKDDTVIQRLIDDGFIEEYHRQAAITLMEMRCAFLGRTTYKLNSIMVFCKEETGSTSLATALDMYDSITHDIKLRRVKIIEYACTTPYADDAACKAIAGINVYRECFEMLSAAMQKAWKNELEKKKGV